jgi:hypothetical protein
MDSACIKVFFKLRSIHFAYARLWTMRIVQNKNNFENVIKARNNKATPPQLLIQLMPVSQLVNHNLWLMKHFHQWPSSFYVPFYVCILVM